MSSDGGSSFIVSSRGWETARLAVWGLAMPRAPIG